VNREVFARNEIHNLNGGVLHLGAHEAEELGFYEQIGAKFVVWVEANPHKWPILDHKLGIGHHVVKAAISDTVGKADLLLYSHADNNSLLSCGQKMPNGVYEVGKVQVDTITVDKLLLETPFGFNSYALLTMDVQGFELHALQGADWFLKNSGVKYIYTEVIWVEYYKDCVTQQQYIDFLQPYGFELVDMDREGGAEWGNLLFKKR